MAVSLNTRLGRYEIRRQLGAGGMGEVYLAFDPKIDRNVASKLLPSALSSDPGQLRPFEENYERFEIEFQPLIAIMNWTTDLKK